MSALGTRLAVCLVWTLALVVPTVECFGKTLQLLKPSTSPTGSSEAPTLAPQMTQCAKHVLNDGKCDHTCADCADCALSSGEYKPCDDACPNHTKTEDVSHAYACLCARACWYCAALLDIAVSLSLH